MTRPNSILVEACISTVWCLGLLVNIIVSTAEILVLSLKQAAYLSSGLVTSFHFIYSSSLPSTTQHLHCYDCLEDEREDYHSDCSVLYGIVYHNCARS